MEFNNLAAGSLVYVTCYGPYWGLKGIIRVVDVIAPANEQESMSFYLVALHDGPMKEPLWLVHDDIAEVEGEDVSRRCPSRKEQSHTETKLSRIEIEALNIVLHEAERMQDRSVKAIATI